MHQHLLLVLLQVIDVPAGQTIVTSPRADRLETDTSADLIVITSEQLWRTGERSLPRQISEAAGIWVQETNLGGGSAFIQGLTGNQIVIVVDGVRLNDATTRQGPNQLLNGIDPATVERVEVLRGPRSVLYGSDALGGAILVWTKTRSPLGDATAQERTFHAGTELYYQSQTEGFYGSVDVSDAYESNAWIAIGSYHAWNDVHSADGTVPNTGYDGWAGFGAWESAFDPFRSLRVSWTVTQDYDVPRTDRLNVGFGQTNPSDSEHEFSIEDRRRFLIAFEDSEPNWLADQIQLRTYFAYYNEERQIRSFNSSTRRLENDTTNTLGLGVDFVKALGESHILTYGLDLDYSDVDSGRTDVDINTGAQTPNVGTFAPGSNYISSGLFAQDQILAFEPFDVTLGLRYGFYAFDFRDPTTSVEEDGNFGALSGNLAVGRAVSDSVKLVGTVAAGYRAPNLSELARNSTFFGGTELANPDLDPESSLYAELACEVVQPTWKGAVAVFHNNISDVIGRVLIDPGGAGSGDEIYERENVGTLEVWGAFLRGSTRLGGVESPWSLDLSAEYTYGQQYDDFVDPITGDEPFYDVPGQRIPPLHGQVALRYDVPQSWWNWAAFTVDWAFGQDRLSPQDLADPRIDPDGTDG